MSVNARTGEVDDTMSRFFLENVEKAPELPDVTVRVVIESPYAGDRKGNLAYLTRCIVDCVARGESPYASHLMLTEALDDNDAVERDRGIKAGFLWRDVAHKTVVYLDNGLSTGMVYGIRDAIKKGRPIELRAFHPSRLAPEMVRRLDILGLKIEECVAQ